MSKPLAYDKVMKYEERLAKGESVAAVQLQYNYKCNFKCRHCSISTHQQSKRRVLTPSDVKDLCKQMDEYGLAQLDLTGGEPLIFKDLDEVIKAIDSSKFYLMCDTNGWFMTEEKATHLKVLGVDKVQISLDSLNAQAHDHFRRRKGSYSRVMKAIECIKNADLVVMISTVVTKDRVYSEEFVDFIKFARSSGAYLNVIPPMPVGEWAGRRDLMLSEDDLKHLDKLRSEYDMQLVHNRIKHFGIDYGCLCAKKILSINAFGDVMPCIWMYASMGNIFETPLKDIIAKGMKVF